MSATPAPEDDSRPIDDRRSQADALASSTPDDKSILMRMLEMLLKPNPSDGATLTAIKSFFGGTIMMMFTLTNFGTMGLLAISPILYKAWDNQTDQVIADRAVAQQQVTATRDVLDAIAGVGAKVDAQAQATDALGAKIDDQGRRLDALAGDVAELQRGQASTARGLNAVRARQRQIEAGAGR